MVPFKPVGMFIGRENIIANIGAKLEEKAESTRKVALTGIGGVGWVPFPKRKPQGEDKVY